MRWNIWHMTRCSSGMRSFFIGQVEAPTGAAAEKKAADLCWSVNGAPASAYIARDPAEDDWHRPINLGEK